MTCVLLGASYQGAYNVIMTPWAQLTGLLLSLHCKITVYPFN